jgi:hypothetical protein
MFINSLLEKMAMNQIWPQGQLTRIDFLSPICWGDWWGLGYYLGSWLMWVEATKLQLRKNMLTTPMLYVLAG